MDSEVYKRNLDTADEQLAHILDAAASIIIREDQLRRTARDLRAPIAKCTDDNGGIYCKLCQICRFNISLK
jgi:hypothetical protein